MRRAFLTPPLVPPAAEISSPICVGKYPRSVNPCSESQSEVAVEAVLKRIWMRKFARRCFFRDAVVRWHSGARSSRW